MVVLVLCNTIGITYDTIAVVLIPDKSTDMTVPSSVVVSVLCTRVVRNHQVRVFVLIVTGLIKPIIVV